MYLFCTLNIDLISFNTRKFNVFVKQLKFVANDYISNKSSVLLPILKYSILNLIHNLFHQSFLNSDVTITCHAALWNPVPVVESVKSRTTDHPDGNPD